MDRFTWERTVWAAEVTPSDKLIALAISNHLSADLNKAAWPSQSRLAEMTGHSRETVNRAIGRLTEAGLLAAKNRPGRSSTYRCVAPQGVLSEPETCDVRSHPPVTSGHTTCDVTSHRSIQGSNQEPSSAKGTQGEFMAAFIQMMGRSPQGGERRFWGRVAKEARADGVAPEDFLVRAEAARQRWTVGDVNPGSVWKHWGALGEPTASSGGIDWQAIRTGSLDMMTDGDRVSP